MQPVPTPHPVTLHGFLPQNSLQNSLLIRLPVGDLEAARAARQIKVASWSRLNLRQGFADEAWMRSHIKHD